MAYIVSRLCCGIICKWESEKATAYSVTNQFSRLQLQEIWSLLIYVRKIYFPASLADCKRQLERPASLSVVLFLELTSISCNKTLSSLRTWHLSVSLHTDRHSPLVAVLSLSRGLFQVRAPSSDRWELPDPQRSTLEALIQQLLFYCACLPNELTDHLTTWQMRISAGIQ